MSVLRRGCFIGLFWECMWVLVCIFVGIFWIRVWVSGSLMWYVISLGCMIILSVLVIYILIMCLLFVLLLSLVCIYRSLIIYFVWVIFLRMWWCELRFLRWWSELLVFFRFWMRVLCLLMVRVYFWRKIFVIDFVMWVGWWIVLDVISVVFGVRCK